MVIIDMICRSLVLLQGKCLLRSGPIASDLVFPRQMVRDSGYHPEILSFQNEGNVLTQPPSQQRILNPLRRHTGMLPIWVPINRA